LERNATKNEKPNIDSSYNQAKNKPIEHVGRRERAGDPICADQAKDEACNRANPVSKALGIGLRLGAIPWAENCDKHYEHYNRRYFNGN